VERKAWAAKWHEVWGKLLGLPIEIVPVGLELAEMAGEIKNHSQDVIGRLFCCGPG
jgi:hypothetical protein